MPLRLPFRHIDMYRRIRTVAPPNTVAVSCQIRGMPYYAAIVVFRGRYFKATSKHLPKFLSTKLTFLCQVPVLTLGNPLF